MSRGTLTAEAVAERIGEARAVYQAAVPEPAGTDDAETLAQFRARMNAWSKGRDVAIARGVLALVEDAGALPVRPVVARFAAAMEAKLRANDHKPGWQGDDPAVLFERLREEASELFLALTRPEPARCVEVRDEAADVANFAMFIADVCGGLAEERPALSRDEVRPDHDARARGAVAIDDTISTMGLSASGAAAVLAGRMGRRASSSEHLVGAANRLREIASELVGLAAERGPA